ncbi:MAG: ATP-binding cassette domain-containing protein [Anaerovoracaceae bacterium]
MAGEIIRFREVTKKYGDVTALDNVDIRINAGAICVIIGEKGSGKSTMLKLIAGLEDQTSGQVIIRGKFNQKVNHMPVGCLIEEPDIDNDISVYDNLAAKGMMIGVRHQRAQITEIMKMTGLEKLADVKASSLSYGERRLLGTALAMVGWPDIILLDEPAAGLDPGSARRIMDIVVKLRDERKMTVVMTGDMGYGIENKATDFIIMRGGRVLREMNAISVREKMRKRIKLVSPDIEAARAALMRFRPRQEGDALYFNFVNDSDMTELEKAMTEASLPVSELSIQSRSGAELFDVLVNGGGDD